LDGERRHFEAAAGEMARYGLTKSIAAGAEFRGGRREILDRNLGGHRRNSLADPCTNPGAPSLVHQTPGIRDALAGDIETEAIGHEDGHTLFRVDANDAVTLRESLPLLEGEPIELMPWQKRDALLNETDVTRALVDAEDEAAGRREEQADHDVHQAGQADQDQRQF